MPNERNRRGHFASRQSSRTTKGGFDLLGSLTDLFDVAKRGGDFTGCASLARVIKDIGANDAPDQNAAMNTALVEAMSDDERDEAQALINAMNALKGRVRLRLGLDVQEPRRPAAVQPTETAAPEPIAAPSAPVVEDPDMKVECMSSDGPVWVRLGDLTEIK